jgi:RHS repeat-associated protein
MGFQTSTAHRSPKPVIGCEPYDFAQDRLAWFSGGLDCLAATATAPFKRTDYGYDTNGNRNSAARRVNAADTVAAETDSYALLAGTNRLTSITMPSGTRSITPDARGNLASETRPGGVTVSAGYDGYARLTSYASSGTASFAHVYNGLDDRVATTTTPSGSTTPDTRRFVTDPGGRMIGEYGASATDVRAEFIWMAAAANDNGGGFGGGDGGGGYMPLAVAVQTATPGVTALAWVHSDHLGTPIVITDSAGTAIAQPTGYTTPAFPGQSKTLADLYYNRYRDYDPTTGRYVQADPIGLDGGSNPYLYAEGNPVKYMDPMGFNPAAVGEIAVGTGEILGEGLWWWCRSNLASCMRTIGPAAIRVAKACKAVSDALSKGGDDCAALIAEINRVRNELARRVDEYRRDPLGLPDGPGPRTRIGHVQQFRGKQKYLQRLLQQALTKGCTGYASDAWHYATRGL